MSRLPWVQMALVAIAGWVNREQLAVIDYLNEENRVLRELHGKRRLDAWRALSKPTGRNRRRSERTPSGLHKSASARLSRDIARESAARAAGSRPHS